MQVLYKGTVLRRPPTKAPVPAPGWLKFNVTVSSQQITRTGPPGKVTQIGKITGVVPQSTDGLYVFGDLKWTNDLGTSVPFEGKVQGKRGDDRTKQATEVPVFVDGERMTYLVADSDPMKFRSLFIPEDTGLGLPAADWSGELTFDYEKGSYFPNNLTFASGRMTDRIVGIINWEKDPSEYLRDFKPNDYAKDARSQYLFNLVFAPAAAGEGKGGRLGKDQEKRMTVTDKSQCALTGRISYSDEGPVEKKETDPEPSVFPAQIEAHVSPECEPSERATDSYVF